MDESDKKNKNSGEKERVWKTENKSGKCQKEKNKREKSQSYKKEKLNSYNLQKKRWRRKKKVKFVY